MKRWWLAALALLALGCTDDPTPSPLPPLRCDAGYADCDGDRANGCETELFSPWHCGACGNTCPTVAHATARCDDGRCGAWSCDDGWSDCDGDPSNGCETLLGSPEACVRCGRVASPAAHQRVVVQGAACALACDEGWGDCDRDRTNGCEAALTTVTNCGACARPCPTPDGAAPRCSAGACDFTCLPGRADCDGVATNGCEVSLGSVQHCAACGDTCAARDGAAPTCVDGACGFTCSLGFGDCDGERANGCETTLTTSIAHCGACGHACPAGERCVSGRCFAACDATHGDCDGDGSCEADLTTSALHCGACGAPCPAVFATGTGACVMGRCELRCASSRGDCDGASANGCEVDLSNNDGAHCGACGRACASGEACVSGVCSLPAPRQWRPQSVSITTTRRPTFAWHLPAGVDGARLEVCADRVCARVEHTANVTGSSYRPPESVVFTEGVHYWRLRSRAGDRVAAAHGPTWLFRAPAVDATYDTAWRRIDDVDGDGIDDVFSSAGERVLSLSATGTRWRSTLAPLLRVVGDLDGDGYADLAGVSTEVETILGHLEYFRYRLAWIRGGPTGPASMTWTPLGDEVMGPYDHRSVLSFAPYSAGDVDGDGYADLMDTVISYSEWSPSALVWTSSSHFSSAGGAWVLPRGGGTMVLDGGDEDGDGLSDPVFVAAGAFMCTASPSSSCVSTRSARLPSCAGFVDGDFQVASVDDFNADGLADLSVTYYRPLAETRFVTYRYLGSPAGFTADRCELVP